MQRLILTLVLFLPLFVFAQENFTQEENKINTLGEKVTWSVDMDAVFDNRECSHNIVDTKTFIFTNLAPEIGFKITSSDRIAGGVVWHQPIGCEWDNARISPTLYYRHTAPSWAFSMGMFPRKQLIEDLPGFLWSDSLTYTQKNIRGVLIQYKRAHRGFFEAYLDWRALQSETQREAFNVVAHGHWSPRPNGIFYIGAHAMMNHYALTKNAAPDEHIIDNFLVNPYIALDLGKKTAPIDSLLIRSGAIVTIERNRGNDKGWQTPAGFWLEATGQWRFLALKNTLYLGGHLLPSYIPFRSSLYPGDAYYQEKFYNRTDLTAYIVRTKLINLRAELNFHFTPGELTFYQRVLLSITI